MGGGICACGLMTTIFTDNFTDANGTNLTAHTPDLGSSWVVPVGALEINTNKARSSTLTGGQAVAFAPDSTSADYQIDATLAGASGATLDGIVFRASDDDDFFLFGHTNIGNNIEIDRCVAGSYSGALTGTGVAAPRAMSVVASGPTVTIHENGTLVMCYHSANVLAADLGVGMRFAGTVAINTMDGFNISTIPVKTDEITNFNTGIEQIILDTDFNTDLGDLGALQALHTLATNGYVNIIAITTMVRNASVVNALYGTNDFYGRSSIPLGVTSRTTFTSIHADFQAIADSYGTAGPGLTTNNAVDLLRSKLNAADANSVILVSDGYLTNISDLIDSTSNNNGDGIMLTGLQLIADKVKRYVCMGGLYGYRVDAGSLAETATGEYNFTGDKASSANVVNNWPTSVPFYLTGFEIGACVQASIVTAIDTYNRPFWDQIAVVFAVIGCTFESVNYWTVSKADVYCKAGFTGYKQSSAGEKYIIREGTATSADTAAFIKNLCEGGAFPDAPTDPGPDPTPTPTPPSGGGGAAHPGKIKHEKERRQRLKQEEEQLEQTIRKAYQRLTWKTTEPPILKDASPKKLAVHAEKLAAQLVEKSKDSARQRTKNKEIIADLHRQANAIMQEEEEAIVMLLH